MTDNTIPDAIGATLVTSPAYASNEIFDAYCWLRADNPARRRAPEKHPFWVATKHADILEINGSALAADRRLPDGTLLQPSQPCGLRQRMPAGSRRSAVAAAEFRCPKRGLSPANSAESLKGSRIFRAALSVSQQERT